MKKAVLVVDMQERYFQEGHPLETSRTNLIAANLDLLHKAKHDAWPIYFVKEVYKSDFSDAPKMHREFALPEVVDGHPMAEIVAELKDFTNDNVFIKKRHSSFQDTDVREVLDRDHVTDLIITGVNTDTCVLSACIGARMDFDVTIIRECVASSRPHMHEIALELMTCKADVRDLSEILNDE